MNYKMNSELQKIMNNVRSSIQPLVDKSSQSGSKKIAINKNEIYIETSTGSTRETNQDKISFAVIENQASIGAKLAVAVLADGMGGMVEGEKAASIAISSYISYIATAYSEKGLKNIALNAANYSNEEVHRHFNGKGGATLSAIVFGKNGCAAVNVGDSRIYHLSRNSGIKQLSVDDTIAGQLRKEDDNSEKWLYPAQGDHRLAQYVGMGEGIEAHCIDLSEYHTKNDIEEGFLLTSDGAHYLGNIMLNQVAIKSENIGEIPKRIRKISTWLSGHDNISIILLPCFFDFENIDSKSSDLLITFYSVSDEAHFVIPTESPNVSKKGKNGCKQMDSDYINKILEELDIKIDKAKKEIKEEILTEVKSLIKMTRMNKKQTSKKATKSKIKKNETDTDLKVDIISIEDNQVG